MSAYLAQSLLRLAQHLASSEVDGGGLCHIVCSTGERCEEPDAAIRWENGFADIVCEHHAQAARYRDALVVYPALNDGTTHASEAKP